jgi:hypothetical protein
MRRSILAFVMVAIVVGVAPPADAVDDGFQGRYRLHARLVQDPVDIGCPVGD